MSSGSLESSKTLAGVGSILLVLSFVPYAGVALGIIGAIMLVIGVKGIADYYHDNGIYQATISGVIFYVIALVAIAVSIALLIVGFAFFVVGAILGIIVFILGLIFAFVFYVLAAQRLRNAFDEISRKSGEHLFETGGLLLFVGAVLTIILVGIALILVGWLLIAIGFFSMRSTSQGQSNVYAQAPQPVATSPTVTVPQVPRFCPNCGAPVDVNATFCSHCGRRLVP